ncbi:SIR2 family protein [Sphingomonas canadensis]|uniref:SIR2 family protein n=1 Tax=Sphingomonas canadensis TaxID=1219257 RepID=A0ABW3HBT2_9SPHN|nr:SIR2 family protein [Sphingomonas canadensis]
MTIELDRLVQNLDPTRTILFFGAGSSIPSGSPSAADLVEAITTKFKVATDGFSLAEVAELAELEHGRQPLIELVRQRFPRPNPTGGILNIPLYKWRAIYTTNYDELLERSYQIRAQATHVVTTNYDFSKHTAPDSQPIFKIHGTIGHDIVDGHKSRMIVTQGDYDRTAEYREFLFNRLAADMAGGDLIIIGYSLSDPDIKAVVDRVIAIQAKMGGAGGAVFLVLYQRDEARAKLFEARGIRIAFGGIDEFSAALTAKGPAAALVHSSSDDPVQDSQVLSTITVDVSHSLAVLPPNAVAMFNGRPATYADVAGDLTFTRTAANNIASMFGAANKQFAAIIGASGVGKTTAARQVAVQLEKLGWRCWEHKTDFELPADEWIAAAHALQTSGRQALLYVDDAHLHLTSLNRIADELFANSITSLRLLVTSGRSQWQYRTKSVHFSKNLAEIGLSKLNSQEIDRLILLVSSDNSIKPLVEGTFSGFSYQEKRRRLTDKCEADAFVCLRNIFAQEKFDDIILREYAQLRTDDQEIYRLVAAMEHAGIRVHRQLVLRLTSISAGMVGAALGNLVDVLSEYDISERFGIYGWKVRHKVIAGIIAKYKFSDQASMVELFDRVIDSLSPTYRIERNSINEMCNLDTGLPSIPDKEVQNRLLRKLISIAPGEPIPRHRLIRNLIDLDKFDLAETEIRVFETDLHTDGPVARYRIVLLLARALYTPGLMDEDRVVILRKAESQAAGSASRFDTNRHVLSAYCDVGLELLKRTGDSSAFDRAFKALKVAADRMGDDDTAKAVRNYERRHFDMTG